MAEYLSEEDMNTGEYISRDDVLKAMQYRCKTCDNGNGVMCRACDTADAMDIICDTPAADVQPVKHGKRYQDYRPITDPDGVSRRCEKVFICSFCGGINKRASRYCGNCGAKMMEGDNDN